MNGKTITEWGARFRRKAGERCYHIAVAIDQLANACLGGCSDETMSARLYRNSRFYWYARAARWVLDLLLSPRRRDHCRQAFETELRRGQYPAFYRKYLDE